MSANLRDPHCGPYVISPAKFGDLLDFPQVKRRMG
jgi:hypothetical protein